MNVLYIEDDALNRRVVRDMLSVAGVEMTEAADAAAGLDAIQAGEFSAVLMDLRMPGMDGLEAIRRLRARTDSKAALPVLVVTADTAIDMRERCVAAGADDVLLKPVAMKPLFDALGRILVSRAGTAA